MRYKTRKWQTMAAVKELEKDIEQYFILQSEKNRIPTVQGLQLHLNVNKHTFEKYIYKRHPDPKNETILVQELFERASVYIECCLLHEGLDNGNKMALWYLSHFKDFSGNYNPKKEIEITENTVMSEKEVDAELLRLEEKEQLLLSEVL